MKLTNILSLFLVIVMLASCATVTFAVTISNPGFESDFSGWTEVEPAAISTSDKHSGSKSAKLSSSTGSCYRTISGLTANTTYTLSAWFYGSGKIGARNYGGSDVSKSLNVSSWTQGSVSFTTGSSNTSVEIYASWVSGGDFRVDDFTLVESGGAPSPTPTVTPTATPTATPSSSPVVTPTPVPTTPSGNLALNKPVTYSGQQTGNEANRAVDGSTSTRWSAEPYPQWIRVDLGANYSINKTELAPYSNRAYQYKIEVSTDGTSFTLVKDKTANTTGGSVITDTFNTITARYVRLTVTGCYNYSGGWASINEFRVFGGGTVATPTPSSSVQPTPTTSPIPSPTPTATPSPSPSGTYPYNVLSLTNWKLTAWNSNATSLQEYFINGNPPLQTYTDDRWFWVTNQGGYNWVNFKAYANYPTTSGSSNPRCELREMTSNGLTEIYWDLTSSNQRSMEWICKVTQVPSSGKVCFAQIHAKSDSYDDLIRVQVRAAANATTGATGTLYVMGYVVSDSADDIGSYTLGDEIHMEIVAVNSTITLNRVNADGSRTQLKKYTGIGSTENYFKAGNYLQSKPTSGSGNVMFRYVRTTPH